MNTTFAPSLFLEKLRNATSMSHSNLEALPISVSIMKPDVSPEEYLLYLSLMHDVVDDAENNIFPCLTEVIPDLEERRKANFLKSDLAFLNHTVRTAKRPISASLPNNSTAFALGIMYVVEGSSLGGRVILKNISNAMGYDADNGAKYFAGYGGQTGSHWRRFLEILGQYEAATNCSAEIIEGADYAFKAITKHLADNTPSSL